MLTLREMKQLAVDKVTADKKLRNLKWPELATELGISDTYLRLIRQQKPHLSEVPYLKVLEVYGYKRKNLYVFDSPKSTEDLK